MSTIRVLVGFIALVGVVLFGVLALARLGWRLSPLRTVRGLLRLPDPVTRAIARWRWRWSRRDDPAAADPPAAEPRIYRPPDRAGKPADRSDRSAPPAGHGASATTTVQAAPARERQLGDGPAPLVRRLVLGGTANGARRSRDVEPRLPVRVAAGCGWHDSFFRGWCGPTADARPTVRLTVRAAALRGATHASNGSDGQDAIGATWDDGHQALYLAVADGLGSLRRSGPVATAAISAALRLCTTRPTGLTFAESGGRLFRAIAEGLRRTHEQTGEPLDGACTLVVAEVIPRFDGAHVTVHGVGDSEAWVLFDGAWSALHHERRTADTATRDLPTHVVPKTVRYEVPPGAVVLLGSDGFAGALDSTASPLARRLAEFWRVAPTWLDFVNHVGFVDDYWSDDRAAVAVWIGDGGADG